MDGSLNMVPRNLSGRDRYLRTLNGEKPDKLPLSVINFNTFVCQYYGITVEQYLQEPELTAALTVRFIQEFRFDACIGTGCGYILYGCGPELGTRWQFVGENFPGCVEGVIKTREDIQQIEVPGEPRGYFKTYLQIIKAVNEEIGREVKLQASALGPFSVAGFLRGIQETLLDTVTDLEFYEAYMPKCVAVSKFICQNVFETGLETPVLNEVFVTPEMVGPDFYHRHIAPYDEEVSRYFGPERLPNSFSAFMGKPDDPTSQREARYLYLTFFGGAESVEVLEKALGYRLAGLPFFLTVSGKNLIGWSTDEILSFLAEGLEYVVKSQGVYPCISLASVQADSRENALEVAEKVRAVREFLDTYKL